MDQPVQHGGELASLEADADRAAARNEPASARRMLEQVTAGDPGRFDPWLKLAAMCRACGDVEAALGAVAGALRIDPFHFTALLLKASLLERAGRSEQAGEAYGHALAQRPDVVPPPLVATVAHAETSYARYRDRSDRRLAEATAPAEAEASAPEQRRIARFRTNITRATRPWHSEPSHFHFPGLPEREFHDREDFPWLASLEAATDTIAEELEAVIAGEHAQLVPYVQYPEDVPLRQWKALNNSRDWTAIHLIRNGQRIEANTRHCPRTMRVLEAIPMPQVPGCSPNAMFSLLAPGKHIPPHNGVANTRLVCHLPLIVPENCWFRVGAETRFWRRGEAWVFDDTIEHEAANDSGELRVILIVDCWHPGLSPVEREAVAAAMAASGLGAEGL